MPPTVRWTIVRVAAALLCLVVPDVSRAQEGNPARIGFLSATPLPAMPDRIEAFRQGLREHGYIEGQNVVVEYRTAEGYERLVALAADLVSTKVDVIVTAGSPAPDAALAATRVVPIVVAVGVETVMDRGVIKNLNRPGGNVTGLSPLAPNVIGKQLALFKETVPRLSRVAVLRDPGHSSHPRMVREAIDAGRVLGLAIVSVEIKDPEALEDGFRRMRAEKVDSILVLRGGMFLRMRERIATLAARATLPTMAGHSEEALAGALMSYGTDVPALSRRAAAYVDKILKGTKPGDIPIEQAAKFELLVNLKTARPLGLKVPAAVLLRADRVIE